VLVAPAGTGCLTLTNIAPFFIVWSGAIAAWTLALKTNPARTPVSVGEFTTDGS
jgi:hypothetical protein